MSEVLQGVLQQQQMVDGMHGWTRRLFKLHPSATTLDVYESESVSSEAATFSLQNVKSARVWGAEESGFDVYWRNGDAWSLLAEDAESARIWVQYFNIALKLIEQALLPQPPTVQTAQTGMTSMAADDSMLLNSSAFGSVRLAGLEQEYAALNEQTQLEKEDALEAQQHYLRLQRQEQQAQEQEARELSPGSPLRSNHHHARRSLTGESGLGLQRDLQASMHSMLEENTILHRREAELQNAHERELETIMANHEGELLTLRSELGQERKRYTALWQKEKMAVDEAEDNEVKLRFELNAARDVAERGESECDALRQRLRDEARRHSSDLKATESGAEERQQGQMMEYNEALLRAKKETETKIAAMQSRFNASLKEMEKATASAARRENDAEMLRVRAACKRESENDIEKARVAERRTAIEELERVKQTFVDRENATVADVQKLQSLHGERMQRYEKQVRDLRDRVAAAETATEEANLKNMQAAERMRTQEETHSGQLRQLVGRAEELETRLRAVFSELQEARTREGGFRDELARSIETQRLQRAELLECRRREQAQEMEAHRWATVAREASGIQSAIRTSEQIARDEVLLLENELRRTKEDKRYSNSTAGRLAQDRHTSKRGTNRMSYSLPMPKGR
jgi:hypothetical protein